MNKPIISVLVFTYNQEKFINKCIDSILKQQLNGEIEILIHDDASTDSTKDILLEYKSKYPAIFKLFLTDKNRFSQKDLSFIPELYRHAKGDYIAICEGDDYWTDEHKLMTQLGFMQKHKDYTLCFHPVKVKFEDKNFEDQIYPKLSQGFKHSINNLLVSNFVPTNSVLYRRLNYDNLPNSIMPYDWYMHIYHALNGKIKKIDKTMAVYRRHNQGVWWESISAQENLWTKYSNMHYMFLNCVSALLKSKTHIDIFNETRQKVLENFVISEQKSGNPILDQLMDIEPRSSRELLKAYKKVLDIKCTKIEEQGAMLTRLTKDSEEKLIQIIKINEDLSNTRNLLQMAYGEIEAIKGTRMWKIRIVMSKIKKSILK